MNLISYVILCTLTKSTLINVGTINIIPYKFNILIACHKLNTENETHEIILNIDINQFL